MRFNLFDHPIAAMAPDYFSPVVPWTAHAPFAFLLVELLEPKTLVELGTHLGMSYCAFCQAVAHLKLPTRCYAVDTWIGDKHTGQYDGDILAFLRKHHDPRYASFSNLLQITFDEAAPRFADGAVDLLHIDGSHDYDAVTHDYQNWRGKLSDQGVVLFHDTTEKQRGFGVHRLWAELAAQYPSFEFHHGHGLGVLVVGKNIPGTLQEFLDEAKQHPDLVRQFFAALGRAHEQTCRMHLAAWRAFQVHGDINRYKRQIGEFIEPVSEDFQVACDHPEAYVHRTFDQIGAMIRHTADLRQKLDAGKK
jgi:O-antigen biosynthesis protein